MTTRTTKELAELVGGELVGDPDAVIKGVADIREAKEGDITFAANPKYAPLVKTTRASCVVTSREVECPAKTLIRTENPSKAFSKIISTLLPQSARHPRGIHPSAVVGKGAKLGKNVSVGANAIIEEGCQIGQDSIIYGGVYVGHDSKIGKNVLIYPNVTIREKATVGDRVIIHPGTVVGSDGFGYVSVDGKHQKIPQVGTVAIEDDVEIGSCVTIDRARFGKTVIGRGSKIDNLVQIAHNVTIGENSIIVAQAGISGSTSLGKNVILAGQAGVVGHVDVGDNVIVMAQAGVTKSVPKDEIILGSPARPVSLAKKIFACLDRLPELFKRVKKIEKKLDANG